MVICSNSVMTPSLSRSKNCYCTGAIKFDGRLNGQSTTDVNSIKLLNETHHFDLKVL